MLTFELAETDKHSIKILLRRKNLRFLRRTNLIKSRWQQAENNTKMKNILLILLIIIVGCSPEKEEIKNGTFELFENDSFKGTIYRMNNFQIEKYNDNEPELISKLDYISDSTFYLSGTEINPKDLDTVFFHTTYKKIAENKFKIVIVPVNSDIEYRFEGILIKTKEEIEKKYIDTLNYLNKNNKKIEK